MKHIFIFIFILIRITATASLPFNEEPWQCGIYQAHIHHDMQQWKKMMLAAEQKLSNSKNADDLFDLTMAFLGYTGYLLGNKDKATAEIYKLKMDQYISKLEKLHYKTSRVMSLQSSSRAFKMALEPISVMTEGPKLLKHINKALESDPDCPYALFEQGNAYFHRPKSFGGSTEKALNYYKKAVDQYQVQNKGKSCDWYYLHMLNQLKLTYEKAGLKKEAAATEEKINRLMN